jgi:hypothetical protein
VANKSSYLRLLINDNPISISPLLAHIFGINEAILIQQIHYWLQRSKHNIEGSLWIYNTYKEWHKQLYFMSESTIKRTILGLEKQGIIIVGTFNRHAWDKTKWYTLNYNKLSEIAEERTDEFGRPSDQIDPIDDTNLTSSDGTNLTQPIPLDYTENTHKITNNNPRTNSSVVPVVSDEAVLVFEREVMGRPLTQMETEQILDLEKD